MGSASVPALATEGGIAPAALLILGFGLIAGFLGMAAVLFWAAADGAESRSRGSVDARLRALDELVAQGLIKPEDYAMRQAALLKEI